MDTRKLPAVLTATAVVVASFAMLVLGSTPASAGPNLLTNSDFDTNIAGWTPFSSTWTWISTEDSAANPASGALEVSITVPGPINTGGVQCVPVTASTAYQISADIKMPSANQPAGTAGNVIWVFFDGAGCTGSQFGNGGLTGVNTSDDTWHALSSTVNSPVGAVSMWFYVNILGTDPGGPEQSHVLYDNFNFSTVDTPTPTPTVTNTPGPATSTPSPTNTSTAATATRTPTPSAAGTGTPASGTTTVVGPAATSTQPGGGSGAGVIGPPDTGQGYSNRVDESGSTAAVAIAVSLAAGGVLALREGARRRS